MIKQIIKDTIRKCHVSFLRRMAFRASEMMPQGKVLIVAPHPDDEVIGCGGLIARLVAEGRMPHVVVMTGGEGSHRGCCDTAPEDITTARRALTRDALVKLGVDEDHLHELNYPDGGISLEHPETDHLRSIIEQMQPDTILVPHWGEGWSDHTVTADIVRRLAAPTASIWEYCVWMWYYNVWRGLDWRRAAAVRMTPQEQAAKLSAMEAYVAPLAPCGKPWSGVLPKPFLNAHRGKTELYFKVR